MKPKPIPYSGLYRLLRRSFGHLNWWPGETRDEIIIGAILTQQASWKNVEMVLGNLRGAGLLDLRKISKTDTPRLERLVRPSGFYRQKASRLRSIARYIFSNYKGLDEMLGREAHGLRKELLSLKGIGRETADSIMLYAAEKPIFVIDAYTRRIMSRIYGTDEEIEYDELRGLISNGIARDLDLYKDFHAQFVELGKRYCRPRPLCPGCPAKAYCRYYKTVYTKGIKGS